MFIINVELIYKELWWNGLSMNNQYGCHCMHDNSIFLSHYIDIIMSVMVSQITGVSNVYSTICSGADQRKLQRSASLAFVRGTRTSNAENVSIWWLWYELIFRGDVFCAPTWNLSCLLVRAGNLYTCFNGCVKLILKWSVIQYDACVHTWNCW